MCARWCQTTFIWTSFWYNDTIRYFWAILYVLSLLQICFCFGYHCLFNFMGRRIYGWIWVFWPSSEKWWSLPNFNQIATKKLAANYHQIITKFLPFALPTNFHQNPPNCQHVATTSITRLPPNCPKKLPSWCNLMTIWWWFDGNCHFSEIRLKNSKWWISGFLFFLGRSNFLSSNLKAIYAMFITILLILWFNLPHLYCFGHVRSSAAGLLGMISNILCRIFVLWMFSLLFNVIILMRSVSLEFRMLTWFFNYIWIWLTLSCIVLLSGQ